MDILPAEQRLAAVLFADLVRYTELSASDGPRALQTVQRLQTIAASTIRDCGGRLVKFTGDGVLAEFGSARAAVRAAIRLTDAFGASDGARRPAQLRAAVHIGELQSDSTGDVFGDGVNAAARLQAVAEPGQVVVSEDVWRQLRNMPDLEFESLGERKLKGQLTPVLVFDVRERRAPATGAGQAGRARLLRRIRRLGTRRRLSVAGWVPPLTVLGIVLVAFLLTWKPAPVLGFQELDKLLILDCDNDTGDELLDGTVHAALTAGLEQSRFVSVFSRRQAAETLERAGHPPGQRIDERVGSEIAQRRGIKALLGCSVGRIGDTYSLTARLIDPVEQTSVLSLTERAESRDEVITALDELVRQIRERLGESLSRIRSDFVALPNATTSSLEALRYWVQSDSLWTAGKFAEAATFLNLAVEEDSAFALAHSSLALYHFFNNRRDEGESHLQLAMADVGRLAVHERLWIDAEARSLRGDERGAINLYKAYLDRDSTDRDAWFNLAKSHERLDECDTAVALYHKVLRLDPGNAGAHINIATCHQKMGRRADAIASYERAFALEPEWTTAYYLNHEYGNAFVALGRYDSAAVIFGRMLDDPDATDQARGHRSLALLEMARGRYDAAAEHLRRAIQLNGAVGAALSEYRDRLHLAVVQDARGERDAAQREIERAYALAEASRFEPGFLAYGGRLLARAGRTKQAAALLEQIAERGYQNATDGAAHAFVKGEIALARGEHEAALEALGRAHDLQPRNHYYLASLADAYRAAGRLDEAVAAYGELVHATPYGWEAQHPAALARLESGRILEVRGDTAAAVAAYRGLSNAWAGGQDDLPMLVEARTRLARLDGG